MLRRLSQRLEVEREKLSAALDELVVEELLFRFDPEAEDLLGEEVEFTGIASAVSVDPEQAVIALR